jgi:hypothetical protein
MKSPVMRYTMQKSIITLKLNKIKNPILHSILISSDQQLHMSGGDSTV